MVVDYDVRFMIKYLKFLLVVSIFISFWLIIHNYKNNTIYYILIMPTLIAIILLLLERNKFIANILMAICSIIPTFYFGIRLIGRIRFVIDNSGMEITSGKGSPLAFLIGTGLELFVFMMLIPLLYYSFSYFILENPKVKRS